MAVCFPVLMCFTGQNGLLANPMGGEVVSGQASFNAVGNTLTVTNTPGAIINWQGFSINANEVTRFAQQSAASAVLNRVVTNNPSVILGTLSSNGQVYLVNPGGIVFGAGSTVDVAGLVATSLNLSDADFLAGRHNFTNQPGAQNISNAGNITAQQGGQIYLIAPNVENTGIITAPDGEILLAAGHEVQLVNSLDPSLRVSITAPAGDATNLGRLIVESGSLGLFGTVVKNTGAASADSATLQGGRIVFKASQRAEISGTVTANSTETPLPSAGEGQGRGVGGTIEVLGNEVGIMDGATVSANGTQDGGTILIGGDYQGKNPDVQNAQVTYVAPTASISADGGVPSPSGGGLGWGNGGKVIIWADDTARIYGSISATGGAEGGNGGFVETSGKRYLDVTSAPNVFAPAGRGGQWLLDPRNVTIQAGPGNMDNIDITAPYFIPAAVDNSTLDVAVINAALNAETTIEVTTGGTGVQLGTITVAAPITKTAGVGTGSLFLTAANEIFINADITASSGQIQFFTAATQVDVNANITLNGGAWDATGGGATVRVDSGAPIINSPLYTGTVNVSAGTATFNGNMFMTNLNVSGGTLTGLGAISIPNTGILTMSGGTLTGSGTITIQNGGTLNWSQGTIDGTAASTLTTVVGSTVNITNNSTLAAILGANRTWDNAGNATWTTTGCCQSLQIDGTLNNNGLFVINSTNAGFTNINGTGTFNNTGELRKILNGTAGTTGFAPTFNNQAAGIVNINSGTLAFNGTGTDLAGSAYNIASGATLQFGQSRNIAGNMAGAGTVIFAGGSQAYTLSGDYNVSGATQATGGCCANTTVNFTGTVSNAGTTISQSWGSLDFSGITTGEATGFASLASITAVGGSNLTFKNGTLLPGLTSLTWSAGTASLGDQPVSLNTLTLSGGTFTGSNTITILNGGAFNWSGNALLDATLSATLTTQAGATTTISGAAQLGANRIWDNAGTATWTVSGCCAGLTLNGTVNNSGVFVLNNPNNAFTDVTGSGTFNNSGELRKQFNTSIEDTSFALAFNNQGTGVVNINSGTLAINGTGTDAAGSAYNVASGTTLQFGGLRTMDGNITGLGTGIMNVVGGTTTVGGTVTSNINVAGGTLTLNGTITAPSLILNGGVLNGSGVFNLGAGGTATQTEGTLFLGTFNLPVGSTYNISNTTAPGASTPFFMPGTFNNSGTVNWNGTAQQRTPGGTTIFNNLAGGQFNIQNNVIWDTCCSGGTITFNNQAGATITKSSIGITRLTQATTLNNSGTLNVNAGTLSMEGTGGMTNSGTINVDTGATFARPGGFTNAGTLAGVGTIDVGAINTLANNGIITPGIALGDTTGTLSITGNLVMGVGSQLSFDINSSLVGDYDVLDVSGTGDLTSGTLTLSGTGGAASYTVLNATGGLGGTTFATINAGTFTQTPAYAATSLTLTVTANSVAGFILWDGGASTANWADALNWSTNLAPTSTDNLYIGAAAGTVFITAGAQSGNALTCDANLTLSGGSLTLGGAASINGVANISGGTFSTASTTQMGTLNWTGGTITGAGGVDVNSLNMPAGTTLNGVNSTILDGKTMNVNGNTGFSSGAANGSNGANLTLSNGAIINNKGIWSINNIANIIAGTGGGTFNNFGEVKVGPTVAATATISTVFNNDNTIFIDLIHGANVNNGSLIIAGGGTSIFDSFNTLAGATVRFTNGYTFNVATDAGVGTLDLAGGTINATGELRANDITISGAVTSSGTLSLAANNNILLAAGSSLAPSSGALNINLNSDFDGVGGGGIYLDTGSSLASNGGNITMGGMPSVGYATGNGTVTGSITFDSGIYVLGNITAGNGNVTMRGEGSTAPYVLGDGIMFAGGTLTSNGMVTIDGIAHTWRADAGCTPNCNFVAGVHFMNAGTRLSTATGTVSISGTNTYTGAGVRAQGITIENATIETTGTGTLALNGSFTGTGAPNTNYGIGLSGGTVQTMAAGGGSIALNGASSIDGGIIFSGSSSVLSNGGEIRMTGTGGGGWDAIYIGGTLVGGSASGNILLQSTNATRIAVAGPVNAGANTLTFSAAGGQVTDLGSGTITAGALRLLNAGTYVFSNISNDIGTLGANVTGAVNYSDTNGFAIGSVTSFDGTATTTTTGVATGNGTFTGTATTGNIALNAGASVNAGSGAVILAAGGNFINNSGSATPITAISAQIWATSPAANVKGGMVPAYSLFNCTYSLANCAPPGGIGFLYTQVTAPTLSIVANPVTKVYGSVDPSLTYAVSGLVGDDLASIVTGAQSRVAGENAGTYAISQGSLTVPAGYGYTLNYTGNNLTITPALLTLNLSASNASKTYGTALIFTGTEFTPVGLIPGDTITGVTLTSTGAAATANAGAYSINITPGSEVFGQGSASNYTIINRIPGTLTVNPAPLTVSANAQSKVYGNIDPALTYTPTGLLFADTLTGSLSRVAGENVGSYAITQGTLSNPNYSISYTGANLSITQRIVSIIASASAKVYGSADPNLFTVGGSGLASWDTNGTAFTGSLSHTGGENVGSYAITQGTLAANSNYSVSGFTGNTLTITPAALTVAGVPVNKVLGTPDPALTYTTSGLQFSDTAATVLNGGSLARDPGETIGTYLVNQGTLALVSANYIMTYVPCNFTILAPTVVQEITQISVQNTPQDAQQGDTAITTAEEEKKKEAAEALAVAEVEADTGGAMAEPLPVCQ